MSYWVAVVARNAAQHLARTLDSLLSQSLRPEGIIVVDDGSTDATGEILEDYTRRHQNIVKPIRLADRGYDIRRVPSNINLACKNMEDDGLESDFFMVSGDDCFYPSSYTGTLESRMQSDRDIVVASGRPVSGTVLSHERSPSGSGRMIRSQFWRQVGGTYPIKAGWEAWLLYAASQRGFRVKLFDDVVFEHLRPRGTRHQFVYWGAAMETLGYHPLYAAGRIAKNAVTPTPAPKRAMNMFRGYVQAKLGSEDAFISPFEPSIRSFVKLQQAQRITGLVSSAV